MQIYKNLFISTSIRIWLTSWEAAVIISNSNSCCFLIVILYFLWFNSFIFYQNFLSLKVTLEAIWLLQNGDHELAFHFPFSHDNPCPGSPDFNTFPSFSQFSILFNLNFWFLRKYFSPLGLEPATSECEPRALTTAPRWFWFSDFKAFLEDQSCTFFLIWITSALSGTVLSGTVLSVFFGLFCLGLFCLGLFCNLGLFCLGLFCLGLFCLFTALERIVCLIMYRSLWSGTSAWVKIGPCVPFE